jgi:membrane-associated protease RseP (regulator of RpoE activity)
MTPRLQIVLSSRPPDANGPILHLSVWQRFKVLFAGIALAIIALSVLIAALVFGSILALVLATVLIVAAVAAILRIALRQARS